MRTRSRRGFVELFVRRVGCASGFLCCQCQASGVSSFGVWRSGHAQCGEDFHCSLLGKLGRFTGDDSATPSWLEGPKSTVFEPLLKRAKDVKTPLDVQAKECEAFLVRARAHLTELDALRAVVGTKHQGGRTEVGSTEDPISTSCPTTTTFPRCRDGGSTVVGDCCPVRGAVAPHQAGSDSGSPHFQAPVQEGRCVWKSFKSGLQDVKWISTRQWWRGRPDEAARASATMATILFHVCRPL